MPEHLSSITARVCARLFLQALETRGARILSVPHEPLYLRCPDDGAVGLSLYHITRPLGAYHQ